MLLTLVAFLFYLKRFHCLVLSVLSNSDPKLAAAGPSPLFLQSQPQLTFIFEDDWSYDFHAFYHGVLGYLERDGVERDHSVQASFIILVLLMYLLV